jgi:hypothetical protein
MAQTHISINTLWNHPVLSASSPSHLSSTHRGHADSSCSVRRTATACILNNYYYITGAKSFHVLSFLSSMHRTKAAESVVLYSDPLYHMYSNLINSKFWKDKVNKTYASVAHSLFNNFMRYLNKICNMNAQLRGCNCPSVRTFHLMEHTNISDTQDVRTVSGIYNNDFATAQLVHFFCY